MSLYACIYAREFPAQALLRLRPDLLRKSCVVLEGDPPLQTVCSCNSRARRIGLDRGMTRVEVETFPDVTVLRRSVTEEASARAALFDCVACFTPSAEDHSSSTEFIAVLDIAGTGRLHGPASTLVRSLQERIRSVGIAASIVIAQNFHATICLARGLSVSQRTLVIAAQDQATALASLPLEVLSFTSYLTPDRAETFTAWGIYTLGDLTALPESALIARMGQEGHRLRQLALGTYPHLFTPIDPSPSYAERIEFDAPVAQLESLLFIVGKMLDQLILRVSSRALAIDAITVTVQLEVAGSPQPQPGAQRSRRDGHSESPAVSRGRPLPAPAHKAEPSAAGQHTRTVRPALPTNDKHLWLKLIHLALDSHPPGAPVLALTLIAEPGRTSKVQMGLFSPQVPDTARLDVALARVRALLGEGSVGTPQLIDTHRPDAFRLNALSVTNRGIGTSPGGTSLTQRQVRPAEKIVVNLCDNRPAVLYFRKAKYTITQAYGPWVMGGDWWNQTLWGHEQWDLVGRTDGGARLYCCVTRDVMQNLWSLVALYD